MSPRSGLLTRLFRANPKYDLVLFDRLDADERELVAGMRQSPGFYGLLKPRGETGLTFKSVDSDTALLFLTLREPAPLPLYARDTLGEAAHQTVARLVADSVLEIEEDGGWICGPAARHLLEDAAGKSGGGRLAELSLAALRWAQAMPVEDAGGLAARLYSYNRLPVTPRWKSLLSSPDAVLAFLGTGPGGRWQDLLARGWSRLGPMPGWILFDSRRRAGGRRSSSPEHVTYKLYVSPEPAALAEGFGALLEAFAATRAFRFKVGCDAWGLLRPDKMVAYFREHEHLAEAASRLASELSEIRAQGVPFTSEISHGGLLSWGVDPPLDAGRSRRESWRSWLARRLAQALLEARSAPANGAEPRAEPWRYALDRLSLEGVDTAAWMPRSILWKES